jgi:rod shape-determining protein MreD
VTEAKSVKQPGVLSELGIARAAAIGGFIIVALALQTTMLTRATLLGVVPQVVLLVVVSFAYCDGERVGTVAGFFGGLLIDFMLGDPTAPVGLTALIYTGIGYGVGTFRKYATSESVWTPVMLVMVSTAVAEFSFALMSILLGERWVSLSFTAKAAGLVILYNTLLTPFVFPLVRRVADKYRPEKVFRW